MVTYTISPDRKILVFNAHSIKTGKATILFLFSQLICFYVQLLIYEILIRNFNFAKL